ncbi:Zinc-regulated outer membrane porin [Richelia intracellularis HH01]|uniref:Zinc-regulated outer membrane porin n=1 Tax=Richelia intracellularis HH01 TaxID=1165094 RepID=M1WQ49_9NOST|nr:iron uptake porin [Richelia intracellularis]CCH66179.1 Zinc-regulated outer membrane porin [Richelia intracellularis HH01]
MKKFLGSLLINSVVMGVVLSLEVMGVAAKGTPTSAMVEENQKTNKEEQNAQISSRRKLSDVNPTDWAFQALQSLVERYGCIIGYPNNTYRGNRVITRYEFAAGLNACLERVNQLIATEAADMVNKEDLAMLQRLQGEFSVEMAALREHINSLMAHTGKLKTEQFSTTTKLQGDVITAVSDVLSGNTYNSDNTTFAARTRIKLLTSFTGKDTLFTRLEANNILGPNISTREGSFSFSGEDGNTDIALGTLYYQFPANKNTQVTVMGNAGAADYFANTVNLFDRDGGVVPLSLFGTGNPIYHHMNGAGLGITHQFGGKLDLSLGYLANSSNNPSNGNGLFNGGYGALTQLTLKPSNRLTFGLTYINAYNQELATGSNRANLRTFLGEFVQNATNNPNDSSVPISSNSYGIQASHKLNDKVLLGGWVGYTTARNLSTKGGLIDRGDIDIWNCAVTFGLLDLGKKGNLAGIIMGIEPKVTKSNISQISEDNDTSLHLEAFYEYQVTDNIAITPGVIWLTAPDHNSNNDNILMGILRTNFSF